MSKYKIGDLVEVDGFREKVQYPELKGCIVEITSDAIPFQATLSDHEWINHKGAPAYWVRFNKVQHCILERDLIIPT